MSELSAKHSDAARRNLQLAHAASRKQKVVKACEHCGGRLELHPCHASRRFCSRPCAYAFMRGPNGAASIGNRKKPFIPQNKGRGTAHLERGADYRIKDGPVDRWRLAVYHRDGFTCRRCGDSRGNNLRAHHIKAWATHPEHRFDVDNGITLCDDCHKAVHARGAKPCSICGKPSRCKGLCNAHYQRQYKAARHASAGGAALC